MCAGEAHIPQVAFGWGSRVELTLYGHFLYVGHWRRDDSGSPMGVYAPAECKAVVMMFPTSASGRGISDGDNESMNPSFIRNEPASTYLSPSHS